MYTYSTFIGTLILLISSQWGWTQMPVSKARIQSEGTYVTVRGVVLNGGELGLLRFVQDSTGGIALYPGNGSIAGVEDLEAGDEILVSGYIEEYQELTEINPVLDLEILDQDQPLPAPRLLGAQDLEDYWEGRHVRFLCVEFEQSGTFQAGTLYTLSHPDGGTLPLYLGSGHPLAGEPIPVGPIDLTGVLSDYDGHQLLIRGALDWAPSPCFYFTADARPVDIQTQQLTLEWTTNTTGTHFVRYGTTPDLSLTSDVVPGTTEPSITLSGLTEATMYYVQPVALQGNYEVEGPRQVVSTAALQSSTPDVYFTQYTDPNFSTGTLPTGSDSDESLQMLLDVIEEATTSIDLAVLNTNLTTLVSALNEAVARGVQVRYIIDDWPANTALNGQVDFPVLVGNPGDWLMHHKFVVADADLAEDATVVLSSTNFTSNGFYSDYNNLLRIEDAALARVLTREFEEMWGSPGGQPNEERALFGPAKDRENTPRYLLIGGHPAELYFTPDPVAIERIDAFIRTAEQEVAVGMYVFTLDQLADALRDQHQAGVSVRGIIENTDGPGAEYNYLVGQSVAVRPHPQSSLFHHKYAVADAWQNNSGTVLTGSYNWTSAATYRNDELILILDHPEVANQFVQEFEARWQQTVSTTSRSEKSMRLRAHPNPSGIYRELLLPAGSGEIELILINGQGQPQWRADWLLWDTPRTQGVDLPAQLPTGTYFLHWKTRSETGVERWLILND